MAAELARYVKADPAEVRRRCAAASTAVHAEWDATVDESDRASVEAFYNTSESEIYGLHWWHTLLDDTSPLAYVNALLYAEKNPGRAYLDFGSGVGSGGLLFAKAGFDVALSDISTPPPAVRHLAAPAAQHPGDKLRPQNPIPPCQPLRHRHRHGMSSSTCLTRSVRSNPYGTRCALGALLFGRIQADSPDNQRSGHIVHDFGPTHAKMTELGLREVWRDDWIWGHYCYQKS